MYINLINNNQTRVYDIAVTMLFMKTNVAGTNHIQHIIKNFSSEIKLYIRLIFLVLKLCLFSCGNMWGRSNFIRGKNNINDIFEELKNKLRN